MVRVCVRDRAFVKDGTREKLNSGRFKSFEHGLRTCAVSIGIFYFEACQLELTVVITCMTCGQ